MTFQEVSRIISFAGVLGLGFYYAFTQPGIMDGISGAVAGVTFYALFLSNERKAKLTAHQEKILEEVDNFKG